MSNIAFGDWLLALAIVALQFGDWLTTRIFVKREGPGAEQSPGARKQFAKEGGVSWKLLPEKLIVGLLGVAIILTMKEVWAQDLLLGVAFWLMLDVVIGNLFKGIVAPSVERILGVWKAAPNPEDRADEELLAGLHTKHFFRALSTALFVSCLGIWVYNQTGRLFLFGYALGLFCVALKDLKVIGAYWRKMRREKKKELKLTISQN